MIARWLAAVTYLLPRGLRDRHGAEIADAAHRLLEREREERGHVARHVLGLRIAVDLARIAAAERRPLAPRPDPPLPGSTRSTRRSSMLDGLSQDVRDALRTLRRAPGHVAAVILTIALGVGATSAIFAVVHRALVGRLPYAAPDRLVMLWEKNPERGWRQAPAAPANLLDWRSRAKSLEGVAGFTDYFEQQVVSAPGEPTPVKTMQVAGDLFGVLGAAPELGRVLRDEETWAGEEKVALLSHRFWRTRFGADPGVVGRRIEIDREPVTIVGVMPQSFALWSDETDIWRPFGWTPEMKSRVSFRRAHSVRAVARLAPGVTIAAARTELESIAVALEREFPATNTQMGVGMGPLRDWLVGDLRQPLLLLFAAVALVLLVGCANVAHLQLARALAREREEAVRGCLGASGWRLARRALVESLLSALVGTALGLVVAKLSVPALVRLGGAELTRLGAVEVGGAALGFGAFLAAVTALVSGAAPAIQARRSQPERALRESARVGEGVRRGRARRLLVAGEVALAVVVVAGALLLVRSVRALDRVEPGFEVEGVVTARLSLPSLAYADNAALGAFGTRLLERVEALPGVEAAGLANHLPATHDSWSSDFSVAGKAAERFGIEVVHREVSPGYFDAMRVPLRAGRLFERSDDSNAPLVVLINETLARLHFAGDDPIGQRICFDRVPTESSYWYTIVGVVGDERQASLARPARPEIFAPMAQDANGSPLLVVRTAGDPAALVPALRSAVRQIDDRLPLHDVRTMAEVVARSRARERFVLTLFAAFALLALTLAAIGVYGVASQAAIARRREIGVRIALGALPREAVATLVRSGAGAVTFGALAGLAGAYVLGRAMSSLLYGVSAGDPMTMAAAPVALLLAAAIATWLPARRAVRIPPAEVLRAE